MPSPARSYASRRNQAGFLERHTGPRPHHSQMRSRSSSGARCCRRSSPALVCVVVGLFSSPKAAWSAAFGAALVIFFFSLTLLVMKRTADLPPTTTMMIVVMLTYTFKVIVLGVVMFAAPRRDVGVGVRRRPVHHGLRLVWLFFEMRSYKRLRIFAYDPDGEAALDARRGSRVMSRETGGRHDAPRHHRPAEPRPTSRRRSAEATPGDARFNLREQDSAWKAVAYLITGPLIYGGLGGCSTSGWARHGW